MLLSTFVRRVTVKGAQDSANNVIKYNISHKRKLYLDFHIHGETHNNMNMNTGDENMHRVISLINQDRRVSGEFHCHSYHKLIHQMFIFIIESAQSCAAHEKKKLFVNINKSFKQQYWIKAAEENNLLLIHRESFFSSHLVIVCSFRTL